jgi:acetylornithine deacetylase/succinyl-diaminopimelate desuccinylase-like protein
VSVPQTRWRGTLLAMNFYRLVGVVLYLGALNLSHPAYGQLSSAQLESRVAEHLSASWPLLHEALSIPNDAHFPEHIANNVAWAERVFGERGFETRRLETGGPPLLLAELVATADAAKTVLVYLQIDGQPVDPSKWDQKSGYTPVLKKPVGDGWSELPWSALDNGFDPEWRVFARSASDAKGPVIMLLTALDALREAGLAPDYHLKLIMDFEEELGSPHLPPALDVHGEALAADWLLIFDGPRHPSNRPTLTFGARGIVDITLTVFGPRRPQHSGHYGNYAPNPAVRLAQLIASMKDDRGRVTIPGFYDGVELTDEVRAILARTPDDEAQIQKQIGIAEPDAVGANYQESIQYPSLNVRGMASAWVGEQARTIVPSTATAEIDVRLVLESDPERLVGLIREHIEDQGYLLLDGREPTEEERMREPRIASMRHFTNYGAFRTPYDSEVGLFLRRALERAFDEQPILIRNTGGSIPIAPFVVKLGLPAVGVPTVNRDNNQHSPNENLRLGNFAEGVRTFLAILTEPIE